MNRSLRVAKLLSNFATENENLITTNYEHLKQSIGKRF